MSQGRAELQLGHMCNNRCVFCVSGQRTERREALPLLASPLLGKILELKEQGGRQLTFVGGEPTLQPAFLESLKYAVELGFEEVVVHTNGVKTARASFVDELLSFGGNVNFRLSFQGATREAHERTTQKPGSFDRLVQSMRNISERGRRISVNMCVVESNYDSIETFPDLLLPFGVWQLHLDMMRPLDSGERSAEELRAMIPRYPLMRPHLERMVAGFPEGFDVNIGNLPFCIAPSIAHVIHHDGETTFTVAVDGNDGLSDPWNKYENKKRDKVKHEGCGECVFDSQCSGFYETYRDFHGTGDFVPVTREALEKHDPGRRLFLVHFEPVLERLRAWAPPAPFAPPRFLLSNFDQRVTLSFDSPAGPVSVLFSRAGGQAVGATELFSMRLLETPDTGGAVRRLLRALFEEARSASGSRVLHAPGDDAPFHALRPARLAGLFDPRLARWLLELRGAAPFGALVWEELTLSAAGKDATLRFSDDQGGGVLVSLAARGESLAAKYQLLPGTAASESLKTGLRLFFEHLRTPNAQARGEDTAST